MQITPDAKRLLLARLGADRALSRAEIDKLVLYAHGKSMIEESDVEAAVGDAAELALDRIVMAAAAGRGAAALAECDRSVASGESPQSVIAALQRHFLRLHRMRGALDTGKSMDDVVRAARPPLHFKQREAIEQQCRAWTLPQLGAALARIADAAKAARLNSALEGTLAEHLLLDLGAIYRTESVGCVKRSADTTPIEPATYVGSSLTLDPTYAAPYSAPDIGGDPACKSTTSSASAMPSSTSSAGATRRSWRGTAAPRAACSWSTPPRWRGSTTTWGRPWRSPAARGPTASSASPRSAAGRASSARPPTTSSARSSATTSAPPA